MTATHFVIAELRGVVGKAHVLTSPKSTRRYRSGYRYGNGQALAVVRPASLIELWRVAQVCTAADLTIIMQAANTGLTGGSSPDGDNYPNGVVIINTMRIAGLHLLDDGRQVVCLPGTTLYQLEGALRPIGREPHSVIGSSCIGASVLGGVCNNSGGSLIRRGPAFTRLALYAKVDTDGVLHLVNHLGIDLGNDPETILETLEKGRFATTEVSVDPAQSASDRTYIDHVRDIEATSPARFNADPRCLFEASGSAGKLILFAVRLDTFEAEKETATFYIGTNDPGRLTAIRRDMLAGFKSVPIAAEYIHRTAFDIAEIYGKDTFLAIQMLGTDRLPALFALKARIDGIANRFSFIGKDFSDRVMQRLSRFFPRHLPARMRDYRDRFEHHLILKVAADGISETRKYFADRFPSVDGECFECTVEESKKAFLHRFAVAGAAVRFRAIHAEQVEEIVALDIALPRNTLDWFERLPADLDEAVLHKLYYGHFFCQVFHQDYVLAKGRDPMAVEHRMWKHLDARGAEYPAEHNVGHLYPAKPALVDFYKQIDPRNQLNPGVGQTPRARHWDPSST